MIAHINGVRIYYETAGEGPPVILLHGNGETHEIYDRLIDDLRRECKVFAVDSRGHGKSGEVSEYHYSDMADDIACLIRELEIRRPVVYGFSDGGIIVLMLASKYPELTSGIISSGPNLNPGAILIPMRLSMRIMNFFKRDPLVRMMLKEPDMTCEDLSRIKVPVLITVAEKDIVSLQHAERIAGSVPDGRLLIVPNENHSSYVVHSDKLFPLISDFIAANSSKNN